ncbi:DNA replication/repair protein RecF [Sinomonas sp. R1AF57]|uniref:DNA replication/repair protein RecF n=1 Tax=Sinomonas sp. R1AF57 TaxID=2020377 RepID=UPI000B5EDF0B|nr:DNA replication/repair protein RecF [Sinomonas sp. R1AF57]ASN53586.1 DNA replication/repair protein RecF [Sinomonas sp. R1AF57]
MYVERLSLTDFRSYTQADLELSPGVTVLVGQNGVGKTNIVEALGMLSTLGSHRVSSDAPLVRFGADRALVRAGFVRGAQRSTLELEINPGRANRGRINRGSPLRARDLLGIARTVLFAPEDLALVKGDPSARRKFLDELLTVLLPHLAGTRADYDRVLKQRNALLKSARASRFSRRSSGPDSRDSSGGATVESTLDVWDAHLAQAGARLLAARLTLVDRLGPHLDAAYAQLTDGSKVARALYRSSIEGAVPDDDSDAGAPEEAGGVVRGDAAAGREPADGTADDDAGSPPRGGRGLAGLGVAEIGERFLAALAEARPRELERGLTLVGPHRDDLELLLGDAPAKGFASHGETWSFALALRLASYYVMLDDSSVAGDEPILILDDVFAELDATRRARLAAIVAKAEQVLVTAAVDADIPPELGGRRVRVVPGGVDDAEAPVPESDRG